MAWGNEIWYSQIWNYSGGPSGPAAPYSTTSPGEQAKADALGTDLFFENDYALTSSKDYVLIEGVAALRQGILHRLITKPGEFKTRPEYGVGLREFVKKPKTQTNINLIKLRIEEQVIREPRVEEVLSVDVESFDGGLKISLKIRASGKIVNFSPFVFDNSGNITLKV